MSLIIIGMASKQKMWSDESMSAAYDSVTSSNKGLREAARLFLLRLYEDV